jgi:penicillin amidase
LAWDFEVHAESSAAAIFYLAYDHLIDQILRDVLGSDLDHAYREMLNLSVLPFDRIIEGDDSPWLRAADRHDVARRAFRFAVDDLCLRFGNDPTEWRWGRIHVLWHRHRLHAARPLRPLLSIGPFEVGGDGSTVNNAHFIHSDPFEMVLGPGIRHIHHVGRWDESRFILSTGNSGNALSLHYRDHAGKWARG